MRATGTACSRPRGAELPAAVCEVVVGAVFAAGVVDVVVVAPAVPAAAAAVPAPRHEAATCEENLVHVLHLDALEDALAQLRC